MKTPRENFEDWWKKDDDRAKLAFIDAYFAGYEQATDDMEKRLAREENER